MENNTENIYIQPNSDLLGWVRENQLENVFDFIHCGKGKLSLVGGEPSDEVIKKLDSMKWWIVNEKNEELGSYLYDNGDISIVFVIDKKKRMSIN